MERHTQTNNPQARDWERFCRICSVPLYGPRELDEGKGDICMTCAIGEVKARIRDVHDELLREIDKLRREVFG